MRRRICRFHERSRPIDTQNVRRLIAIVIPDAIGRGLDDLDVGVRGGGFLQKLQVPHEDTLELRRVRLAVRFAWVVQDVVRICEGRDSSICDLSCSREIAWVRGGFVQFDKAAKDDALVVAPTVYFIKLIISACYIFISSQRHHLHSCPVILAVRREAIVDGVVLVNHPAGREPLPFLLRPVDIILAVLRTVGQMSCDGEEELVRNGVDVGFRRVPPDTAIVAVGRPTFRLDISVSTTIFLFIFFFSLYPTNR